jgi:hypothetical protein
MSDLETLRKERAMWTNARNSAAARWRQRNLRHHTVEYGQIALRDYNDAIRAIRRIEEKMEITDS